MTLLINTADHELVEVALIDQKKVLASQVFAAPRSQSELLLPAVDKLLKRQGVDLKDLQRIRVADQGGSFTSLRIGILTANALAYALGIPIEAVSRQKPKRKGGLMVVAPQYDREPNIG